MSDQYVQLAVGTAPAGSTDSATLTGVTAGNTLVAIGFDGSGKAISGVADAQGSYSIQGSVFGPDSDSVIGGLYVLQNANAGSHTATVTLTGGGSAPFIILVEVGALTSGAVSGSNGQINQNTAGTDGLSSGSVTITGAATLVAAGINTQSVGTGQEPATGTSGTPTSRNVGNNGSIGSYRVETYDASSNRAGTFTITQSGQTHMILAVAILNAAGGGATIDAYLVQPPMAAAGRR